MFASNIETPQSNTYFYTTNLIIPIYDYKHLFRPYGLLPLFY